MVKRRAQTLTLPRDVDQHSSANDTVLGPAINTERGVTRDHPLTGCSSVEAMFVVFVMSKPVDLARAL